MSDLMTLEDIAAMWHCTRRHARDILTKLPDFPAPAPGSTVKRPVWLRSRVQAFASGEPANDFSSLQTA
jgi:hypothetical protein